MTKRGTTITKHTGNSSEVRLSSTRSEIDSRVKSIEEACEEVYKVLGPGRSEDIYQKALAIELRLRSISYQQQVVIELHYKGNYIADSKADFVVRTQTGKQILVELKTGASCTDADKQQVRCYLEGIEVSFGVIFNFWKPKTKWTDQSTTVEHHRLKTDIIKIRELQKKAD
jgi:GxxExxY protein